MTTTAVGGIDKPTVRYSEGRRILKVFLGRKLAVIGLVIIVILIITALAAPWLAPYDPDTSNVAQRLQGIQR